MLLFGSQIVGPELVGLCTESAFSGREREEEEIGVVNHLERVRPPEVELRLLYILYQSFGSCRPQIKAVLNHSTSHWGMGRGSTAAFHFLMLGRWKLQACHKL